MPLIEPDSIHQAFHGAVEVCVFEDDERRLAAQLKRNFLMTVRSSGTDRAPNFRRTGECDLVHVRMLHQRFAGRTVTSNNVDHTGWQSDFLTDFSKRKRGKRSELCRLEYDSVARGQRGRNLPCHHKQREIPGNDLPDNTASRVSGKFLFKQLRPASVMIKMTSN